MGIQSFSSIIQNLEIEKTFNEQDLENKKLYLDFNSLIHNISQDIIGKINNGDLSFLIELEDFFRDELTLKLEKKGEQIEYNKKNLDIIIIYYLLHFLLNKMKITQADFVYISIDGVPSVGKMTEQRQRKFMGKFEKFFKKKRLEEMEKERMKKQDTNFQNISNTNSSSQNVSWDKTNISPGTSFMKTLEEILEHKFNEPKYIISGSNEPGEGEHKISQHIKNYRNSNDIIYIFSPDNDANLLALINNSSEYTYIFKIDIKKSNPLDYKFVKNDISVFREGLLEYFKQGILDKYSDNDLLEMKNRIIDNIVLIYSFFGNDFIPNLESIDIRSDMTYLILTFKEILQDNNDFSLFKKDQEIESNLIKYKFNLKNFMNYLRLLFKDVNFEKFLLRKKFFNSLFFIKNYEKLNNQELSNFIDTYLKQNKISYDMIPTSQVNDQTISNLGEGGGQGVPPSRSSGRNVDPGRGRGTGRGRGNQGYQPNLGRGRNQGRGRGNQYKDYRDRGNQGNQGYLDKGRGRGRGNQSYAFKKEPTIDTFKIQYEKYLGNTNLEDTESNRLNFTISRLFPNDDFNLGKYLQIDKYNELGNYKANDSSDKFEELKDKFNKNNFVDDVGLRNAIENYIFGINWILEVYFNQDYNYYKYWFYPYEKSPLIMDIITYQNINNLYDDDSGIIKEEFFNKFDDFKNDDNNISEIEQILFTTPDSDSYGDIYNKHPDIFKKIIYLYNELYKSYVNILYFNLEDEVNYLFDEEKKIVDCGNAFYLSKCSIIFANFAKAISFKDFKNKYEEILKDYHPEEEGKIDEVVKEKIEEEGKIEEIKEEGEIYEEKKEVEEGLIGGYYKKYLKYKRKYLKLKNLY